MKAFVVHCLFDVPVYAEDAEEAETLAVDMLNPELMHVCDSDFKVVELDDPSAMQEALEWIEEKIG